MTELPSYFEYALEHDTDFALYPFSYDASELAFTIGKTIIPLADFDPYMFMSMDLDDKEQEKIELTTATDQYALMPELTGVIGCPKLHDWAWRNPDAFEETRQVMHAAFTAVYEKPEDIELDNDEHGFMGFAVGNRENDGEPDGLHLQVFGNCACMGPHFDGLFVQGVDHGFAQYDLHNADIPAQRAGLYAGLGHLAKLASEA